MYGRGEALLRDLAKLHQIESRESSVDAENAKIMFRITRSSRWQRVYDIAVWEAARQASICSDILRRLKRLKESTYAGTHSRAR